MRKRIKPFVVISSACMATLAAPAFAQNIPAQASGNWETPSVWVGGGVLNSSNNVYISATDPAGAMTTAAVTLTANESINSVFVGYGTPTNGTLNLNGHAGGMGGGGGGLLGLRGGCGEKGGGGASGGWGGGLGDGWTVRVWGDLGPGVALIGSFLVGLLGRDGTSVPSFIGTEPHIDRGRWGGGAVFGAARA